jgi:hypothetical protein
LGVVEPLVDLVQLQRTPDLVEQLEHFERACRRLDHCPAHDASPAPRGERQQVGHDRVLPQAHQFQPRDHPGEFVRPRREVGPEDQHPCPRPLDHLRMLARRETGVEGNAGDPCRGAGEIERNREQTVVEQQSDARARRRMAGGDQRAGEAVGPALGLGESQRPVGEADRGPNSRAPRRINSLINMGRGFLRLSRGI